MQSSSNPVSWSSRAGFIMAAVGAAVGLGNIWKFPYVTGVSGGGAFVLVYIGCVLIVAIPILIGELMIGRRGHRSPPVAMGEVAKEAGRSRHWSLVGWMGAVVAFLIVSYYSVIAGWVLAYVFKTATGVFAGASADFVNAEFEQLLASPGLLIGWHTLFMGASVLIVARGLQNGIEGTAKILMPALFAMLLLMIGYSAVAGDFAAGVRFLFDPDFSKIDGPVVLSAIGQAFFSIGVAMGLMMAYGAYLPKEVSITRSAFIIAGADTLVALLAGIAIFPLVFINDLNPAQGPGLIFVTLPTAFAQMPFGSFFGAMFFVLLTFAAITSAIALLEPIVAWGSGRLGLKRPVSAVFFGGLTWLVGLASVFSFNIWSAVRPLGGFPAFAEKTLFDLVDYVTANVMMPLGGLLIAVFVGWRVTDSMLHEELPLLTGWKFSLLKLLMRFVAPLAILGIFISNLT